MVGLNIDSNVAKYRNQIEREPNMSSRFGFVNLSFVNTDLSQFLVDQMSSVVQLTFH